MLGYLSLDIICSSKLTGFLELRSRKAVRFSEQIMSADKYPSIFSRQMKAIVYVSLRSHYQNTWEHKHFFTLKQAAFKYLDRVPKGLRALGLRTQPSPPIWDSSLPLGLCLEFDLTLYVSYRVICHAWSRP